MSARVVRNESGVELDPDKIVKKYARYAGWFRFFAWLLMTSAFLFGCALLVTLVYVFEKTTGDPIVVHKITVWFAKLTGILALLGFVFGFARWRCGKLIDQVASTHWVVQVGSYRADYLVKGDPLWTIYCGRQLPMIFPCASNYFPPTGKVEWDAFFIKDGEVINLDIAVAYDMGYFPKLDDLLAHFPKGLEQMEERIISDVNLGLSGRITAGEDVFLERGRVFWPPENQILWFSIKVTESEANPQTKANTPSDWLTNDAEFGT